MLQRSSFLSGMPLGFSERQSILSQGGGRGGGGGGRGRKFRQHKDVWYIFYQGDVTESPRVGSDWVSGERQIEEPTYGVHYFIFLTYVTSLEMLYLWLESKIKFSEVE